MQNPFQLGDQQFYELTVREADTAIFESGQVHPVYATFALARDAEWACRLFVLAMKEPDEEGIGTSISVAHQSPALVGSPISIIATLKTVEQNTVICAYEAYCRERLIAHGEQGQKILKKTKLEQLFAELNQT